MWKLLVMCLKSVHSVYLCWVLLRAWGRFRKFPDWVDNELYTYLCNWLLLLFMLCCSCSCRRRPIPSLCYKFSISGAAGSTAGTYFWNDVWDGKRLFQNFRFIVGTEGIIKGHNGRVRRVADHNHVTSCQKSLLLLLLLGEHLRHRHRGDRPRVCVLAFNSLACPMREASHISDLRKLLLLLSLMVLRSASMISSLRPKFSQSSSVASPYLNLKDHPEVCVVPKLLPLKAVLSLLCISGALFWSLEQNLVVNYEIADRTYQTLQGTSSEKQHKGFWL